LFIPTLSSNWCLKNVPNLKSIISLAPEIDYLALMKSFGKRRSRR
jgi:hypothetical protein